MSVFCVPWSDAILIFVVYLALYHGKSSWRRERAVTLSGKSREGKEGVVLSCGRFDFFYRLRIAFSFVRGVVQLSYTISAAVVCIHVYFCRSKSVGNTHTHWLR